MIRSRSSNVGTFNIKNLQKDSNCVGAYVPQIWGGADQLVRRNLLLNTATLATQNVTTLGLSYTLYLKGTGSVTLSGAATGTLNGTGAGNRVSLQFTPTAGTLTLTVSGSVTEGHLTRTATTDHSYQAITDWTTEVYAYNATRKLPWLRRNIRVNTNLFSAAAGWGKISPTASESSGTITFVGSGNDYWVDYIGISLPIGTTITVSCEIKSASSNAVSFGCHDVTGNAGVVVVNPTTSYVRYQKTFVSTNSSNNARYGFDNRVSVGGSGIAGSIDVRNLQIEVAAAATEYQDIGASWPSTYTALAQAAGYPISLYSDRAGTIAVDSPETVVGKALDLSTKGNHLVAPSDSARPLLKRDGNGNYYLLRDLVDDSLNVTLPNYGSNCVHYRSTDKAVLKDSAITLSGATAFSIESVDYGRVLLSGPSNNDAKIQKFLDSLAGRSSPVVLGPELVTNGGFDSDTWWAKDTGCTISDGTGNINVSSLLGIGRANLLTPGKTYFITWSITSYTSGGLKLYVGALNGAEKTAVGTYTEVITCGASTSFCVYRSSGTAIASIDNVSVKEVLS